ncbi:serine hydrolase domain-containing protein [Streptomyces radicis]|uniref:Class A beta-lactamase-related serine hydrolase n=1 Tax=Streptomyces radicis TaxID=1750517 RepID=A0A3A9WI75_9ACTN|nr:serine hydrolase domain-containing protein [Streptomyces radicis]RKN12530.1 class A beta-lactamase-related serine hydrolase [Streptomyces radicis]RKN27704.1 class A beta-lactamase-related serine hydrolase [Streptomyces radicis]
MRRRRFLHGLTATAGAPLLTAAAPHAARADDRAGPGRWRAGPPTLTPDDIRFPTRSRALRYGRPDEVGLIGDEVARIVDEAEAFLSPGPGRPAPSFPGFVLLAARDGVIVAHEARGHAVRYSGWDEATATPVELPRDAWVPMARDTIFDLASVSKLFTATVATRLAERGALDLDAPVAATLPEFAAADPAKAPITARQLLVHRSGLVAWLNLWSLPDNEARLAAIHASPLAREPGSGYAYSDLNLIVLGTLVERLTGHPLDTLVAEWVTGPLGMADTRYNPPPELLPRIAATEYQPATGRGMVRGSAHDENAWAFGGVAGHAGLFSTAADLAILGQLLADGGQYAGTRLLATDTVRQVLTDHNADIGASPRGLGWQVDQRSYMDALCSPVTAGHTGYTGTSITVDPVERTVFVLLTNRVHPTRTRGTDSVYRRRPARAFARSFPVRPVSGLTAWRAGAADGATATLTTPVRGLTGEGRVAFRLWYDTEPDHDIGAFEASGDGGASWAPVPLALRSGDWRWETDGTFHGWSGRRWAHATATVPAGTTQLRWTYRTDPDHQGRGVLVDAIRVTRGHRLLLADERPADAARFVADGWTATER